MQIKHSAEYAKNYIIHWWIYGRIKIVDNMI